MKLGRWLPVAIAVGAAGVLALVFGPTRAIPLLVLAAIGAVLVLLGVDIGRPVAALARWLEHAIGLVGSTFIFVFLFIPAWAVGRIGRRGPMGSRRGSGWDDSRALVHPPRRSLVGRLSWAVGCVVLLLAANYAVGWIYDTATGRSGPDSLTASVDPTASTTADPRAGSPAMAGAGWSKRYFADLQRTPSYYWPYTELRPGDFRSPYINVTDWVRRSWQPTTARRTPVVWFLGGSTTFGEGQRDDHTIASELARIADAAGTPIRVRNYGQRGWTSFQELVLLEQQLALHPAPDLVVFTDGANDVNVQAFVDEPVPSHYQVPDFARRIAGARLATRVVEPGSAADPVGDAWHEYTSHSAAHKVLALFRSQVAGAAEDPATATDANGQAVYPTTVQDGTDAGKVYERTKALIGDVSRRADVEPFYFWQPMPSSWDVYDAARAELSSSTVDLTETLMDHQEVFLDGVHTNEEGARLVAEAMWPHLRPAIDAWYEANP